LCKVKVGNFANKIKSYRLPDSYKGKGIWYKNEVKILKEVKKT
jgi:ribosomal protein L6P/L9E